MILKQKAIRATLRFILAVSMNELLLGGSLHSSNKLSGERFLAVIAFSDWMGAMRIGEESPWQVGSSL